MNTRIAVHAIKCTKTLLTAAALTLVACNAFATDRWVDDGAIFLSPPGNGCIVAGYKTIRAALAAASPGDTIKVCPGLYTENPDITVPNLTIVSTSGPYASIVKSATLSRAVFHIRAAQVTLNGFGIRPAGIAEDDSGVFIQAEGPARATVQNNVILSGRAGIQVGCTSSENMIVGNLFKGQDHAAINLDTCEIPAMPGTHHNTVYRNVACGPTLIASIAFGGTANYNYVSENVVTKIKIFGNGNEIENNASQLPISNMGTGTVMLGNMIDSDVCN